MHDTNYSPKTPSLIKDPGYSDILAKIDYATMRRCPLTKIPHFLVDFYDPISNKPLAYCPRSLLKRVVSSSPFRPMTGIEFEFFNFQESPESLKAKKGTGYQALTPGMFGYSLARPAMYQDYFDNIYDLCRDFRIPLECFHTETGPGVYEAAIEYTNVLELADRAHLFKMLTKKIGLKRNKD